MIAFPASTALADSALGWASIFYVFGGATIAWVLLWLVVVSSSPADHPSISAEVRCPLSEAPTLRFMCLRAPHMGDL